MVTSGSTAGAPMFDNVSTSLLSAEKERKNIYILLARYSTIMHVCMCGWLALKM